MNPRPSPPRPAHPAGSAAGAIPSPGRARLVVLLPAVAVAAIVALALAGCGTTAGTGLLPPGDAAPEPTAPQPTAAQPTAPEPTVPDATGATTDPGVPARRILPLRGNINELVFALGFGAEVVGRDESATFPEAASLPVVTRGHDVSAEAVLSLRPTLVLAQEDDGPPEALEHIRNAGVTVEVVPTPTTIDGISPRIRRLAALLGVPDRGDELAASTDVELAKVQRSVPVGVDPPAVAFLYMRGQAGVYLIAGKGSGADSMIRAAGGIDAGTAMGLTRAFTPITSEALAKAAPDVILMTTTGLESVGGIDGLVQIPGIAQTPAGRNRRVITQEDGLLFSFGARTPEALRALIDDLHAADASAPTGTGD